MALKQKHEAEIAESSNSARWIVGDIPSPLKFNVLFWATIVVVLGIYYLATTYIQAIALSLPQLQEIVAQLDKIIIGEDGSADKTLEIFSVRQISFLEHLTASLRLMFLGIVSGTALGFPIAMVLALSPFTEKFVNRVFPLVFSIPRLALAYVVLVVVGFGLIGKVATIFTSAFVYQILLVFYGSRVLLYGSRTLEASRRALLDRAVLAGATRWQLVRYYILPGVLPHFFQALRLAIVSGWSILIIVESIGDIGLGRLLSSAFEANRIPAVFAITFIFAVLNFVVWRTIQFIEERVLRWQSHA